MKKLLPILALTLSFNASSAITDTKLKDFDLQGHKITLMVPEQLSESFVTSPENIFITYTTKDTAYSIIFKFSLLSEDRASDLMHGNNFINTALLPYNDKERGLYGEYKILSQDQNKNEQSVLIDSYLTKQADEYLPEAYFKINEYIKLKGTQLSSISCRAAGARAQKHIIDSTFSFYQGMCHKLIEDNKERIDTVGHALKPKP